MESAMELIYLFIYFMNLFDAPFCMPMYALAVGENIKYKITQTNKTSIQ